MSFVFQPGRRQVLAIALGEVLCAPAALARPSSPLRVPLFVGTGPASDETRRMLAWLAQQLQLDWDLRPTPWLRAQRLAAAGEGLMFGLARTAQREQELRFSQPVWTKHTWAVIRQEDAEHLIRPGDLNGLTACWARGSSYADTLQARGITGLKVQESADDDGALNMLVAGRCRVAMLTLATDLPRQALRHPALDHLIPQALTLMPTPLADTALHFVTGHHSRWAPLIDRIDAVISRNRPTLERLQRG